MLAAVVLATAIAAGWLLTTASVSSAATGDTNVCTGFTATFDPTTNVSTGTLTGCHQQASATTVEVANPADPFAPTPVTINWATGRATSVAIASVVPDFSPSACPVGDVAGDVSLRVVQGPYSGSTGGYVICLDLSAFPVIHATSAGPIVI